MSPPDVGLKLLALDGGGIRGLSELLIVKEIMHRLMFEENETRRISGLPLLKSTPKPCDYFDLIGGTSTGGIIALMLGRLRMDVDTAIMRYNELAKKVFSDVKLGVKDGKFKATKLEEAIKSTVKDITGDPETSLLEGGEAICRTFVCARNAHNMDANIPVLFRTYDSRETHSGCAIWEAARATSAAPTFFKRIEIGRRQPFIDGGLGRNNPSRLVLEEAQKVFQDRQLGCLVSIGTGQGNIISIDKPGFFQKLMPTDVIDALKGITTDCEATHQEMLGLFKNYPNVYFRLNVEQGMQGITLSEWEKLTYVEAHTAQYMKRKEGEDKLISVVKAIRSGASHLVIEQLTSPKPSVRSAKDRKLCPLPVSTFTGRKDILQKMHNSFDRDPGCQNVFVLHGLGGAGKSQLAYKFAHDSQANHRFSEVFYVDATNGQTLADDLRTLAPTAVGESAEAILRWLAGKREEWLLLFDNADDTQLDLSKFFPPCTFGNILITTRNQELCVHASSDSDSGVSDMDQEDARDLLFRLSRQRRNEEQDKLAAAIVKEVHCFALAVSQAGCYIHNHCTFSKYLKLYQSRRDQLLQRTETQKQKDHRLPVYTTWNLSYEKLSSAGKSMLQICSILHHKGISEEMFQKAATSGRELDDSNLQNEVTQLLAGLGKQGENWDSLVFLGVMKEIQSYSLIELDRQNNSYAVHPLVQHWSGTTIAGNKHRMQKCVLSIIGMSVSWMFRLEDYKYRHELLQHVIRSMDHQNIEGISLFVADRVARVYYEAGLWKEAEALQMVVMKTQRQTLGDEHPDTLHSMAHLAATYRQQGRWKDAEALEVVVMERRRNVLGDEHPDTLTSMANLAATYRHQGHWKDAEALEVVVMERRKNLLGDEHPDTLTSMANLAATYRHQGHWKDAEALEVVVMERRKTLLGDEHPDTLASMGHLAATYRHQGRWKDAEALEVVVMERMKTLLGDEHPDTLNSMGHLAATYRQQGRWKDAEALEVVVMERRKNVLGDEHPDTLTSMANLAATYWQQGRWKDAEALQLVVLERTKNWLGDEHPDTLHSMAHLAVTYRHQGHWKDAEALEVVVMETSKTLLGDEHPDTLNSMGNLAGTYLQQGRWKDAEALEVVVMERRKTLLGDEHPDTLASMGNLAATYRQQGRWKDAEALEVVVMETSKTLLGDDHPDTLNSMANLAATYRHQGRWKDAEALEVVVMERRKTLLGDEHPDTLASMGHLAATHRHQGRWKDAEALEVVVMERMKTLLGDEHPDTLTSMANLAATYWQQGRWKDAEALQLVVLERTKNWLGDEHPDTLHSMAHLAVTYRHQGHWKDAEALEVVVMETSKTLLGDEHPDTLNSMGNLAGTYLQQGRWKDAEALEVVVMERRKTLLGDEHPDTLASMGNLAATYRQQGRWKDAEALEVVVMERRKTLLGDEHPDTLASMGNLAATYRQQGRWKDAEALEVVVMERRKTLLGDEHPDTLISMTNLAATYRKQGRWTEAEVLEV
ncbi:hypothetical protein B0H16DRAFT_1888734, partial [Mycena metata]